MDNGEECGNEKSQQRTLEISGLEEKCLWWKEVFFLFLFVFLLSMWVWTLIIGETEVYISDVT